MLKPSKMLSHTNTITILLFVIIAAIVLMNNPDYKTYAYKHYSNRKNRIYTKYSQNVLNQPHPVSYVSKIKLDNKLIFPAAWIQQQINKDFTNYNDTNISKQNVIATYNTFPENDLVIMFQIENSKLIVTKKDVKLNEACINGLRIYTNIFEYFAKHGYVENVSFLLRLSDFISHASLQQLDTSAPILTTSKDLSKNKEKKFILIPDYMSLEDIPKIAPRVLHANKTFTWQNKQNKILWRGGHADVSGFRHLIVAFSEQHPESIIDAKFTVDSSEFVLPEMQIKAKYLLNIDGHTAAWTRPIWQLLSNSVMLKQDSSLTQWYYAALQPGVHYIPINNDPNQLECSIAAYTDTQLQIIANNGSEFAKNNLTFDDMLAYLVQVLRTYENLQNGKTI
jgi:hypothetical protein